MSYIYSLVSGLLFGIGYGLLGLKSPAPPLIALAGLLGMLGGDQLVTQLKNHLASRDQPTSISSPDTSDATASDVRNGEQGSLSGKANPGRHERPKHD